MPRYAFEPLTARDASFLAVEGPNTPMHVTGVAIHKVGRLRREGGGLDVAAYRRAVSSVLHRLPRYRQRLRRVPFERLPVWVDDPHFSIEYHVRHTALPRPGTVEELKKKAARILVQPLDHARPLWETWVVEGLEGDRFALIWKVHHALGRPGAVDLDQLLLSPDPDAEPEEAPPYRPHPEPSARELLRDAWRRRLRRPFDAAGSLRELRSDAEDFREELAARGRALASQLGQAASRVSETPLNGPIGPHRRIEWLRMALDDVRAVRKALACTTNDIVLATVAGAVRQFFLHRHTDPAAVEFRVSSPVGVQAGAKGGAGRQRVTSWMLRLPLEEAEPRARVEAIREANARLAESRQALGVETIRAVAEWTPSVLLSLGARALASQLPAHLSVTNVPGPRQPLYLLGSELLEWYGAFPLGPRTGLGIAVTSYRGRLCWGFVADRDLVPDLVYFARGVGDAFDELARTAGVDVKGLPPEAHGGETVAHGGDAGVHGGETGVHGGETGAGGGGSDRPRRRPRSGARPADPPSSPDPPDAPDAPDREA